MGISIRQDGEVRVIQMSREITLGRGRLGRAVDLKGRPLDDLSGTLQDLVQSGQTKLILDLSEVAFIDSAGLGELIAFKKRTKEAGGDIKLLKPTRRVFELLDILRLTSVFEVYTDEREAVEAFKA
jgi:anti-sigma B factor antagonist